MRPNQTVIIFDADGTLYSVNAAKGYSRLYGFLGKKTGLREGQLKRRHRLEIAKVSNSRNPAVRGHFYSIEKLVNNDRSLAKKAEAKFWSGIEIKAKAGAKSTLERLRKKYRLAIASDEFLQHLSDKMDAALGGGWKKYFECVVTPDSTKTMKPSGKYYRIILKKLKVGPSEAIVVGNSWKKDLEPAARMGMKTVLAVGGGKGKGRPDFSIRKLSGLLKILGDA